MSLLEFIQLIIRNKKWVLYFPLIVGLGVLMLTLNMPHMYDSEMVIYTGIASGFNPDNDFENKIDFHAVNSRFDNLINIIGLRETRRDVAVKLLTFMIHNPDKLSTLLKNANNGILNETLTDSFVARYKKVTEAETETFLRARLDSSGADNEVYQLIYGEKKNPLNVKTLEDIKAERQGFSDMLKISYTCEDPLTCKMTLDITKDLFLDKYQGMRIGEANQAVSYFREQTAIAKGKLVASEESLKKFRGDNRVINYYEQTKYIADQNESIEKNLSQLQMDLDGYRTALKKVEDKIGKRFLIQLQSEKIVHTRDSLAAELTKSGLMAVQSGTLVSNTPQVEDLKESLKEGVTHLYALNNTVEGVPGKKLLDEWLDLTVSTEETESKLRVITANKLDFDKVFERYAPMGSELNKLEREVETAEKEYLNLLHSLNQAILRARNLEVSETVEVIDDADMPIVPNPSKKLLLVIASVLSCIIIAVVILIIRQYLDKSLASPISMEKITGLKAATAFISSNCRDLLPNAITEMDSRSLERWRIAIGDISGDAQKDTVLLAIPFNCPMEQVSAYVQKMSAFLDAQGYPVHLISMEDETIAADVNYFAIAGKIFPELLPKAILAKTKTIFFFFDATQNLDEYQMQILDNWKKTGIEARGILVNTCEPAISKYLGEIPLKRSKIRAFVKKQFKRYAN